MRRVLINMQNFLFGDAIEETLLHGKGDFEVKNTKNPEEVIEIAQWYAPYALLMEVTAYTPWRLEERLKIRDEVKKRYNACKIVLIIDENSERELADLVLNTKKRGLIDQFIYGSISASYLSAAVDTL